MTEERKAADHSKDAPKRMTNAQIAETKAKEEAEQESET